MLSNAVSLTSQQGLEILRHTDAKMGVHVTAEVNAKITNANDVLASLQESTIPSIVNKYGLQVSYKGRAEEERETGSDMKQAACSRW